MQIADRDTNGQSIKLGETDVVPSLRIDFQSTDNTFRSENDGLESTRTIINPEIIWYAERRLLMLKAKYEGHYAIGSENISDFTDHLVGFSADADLTSKHKSRIAFSIATEHDDIGSGVLSNATELDSNEVAEFTEIELVGAHTYGATAARGNLTGGLRIQSRDFRNQTRFTNGRSLLRFEPFATFGYRVSAETRLIVGGRVSNLDFDNDTIDRVDTSLFTGIDISATGKLTGFFRIGATNSALSESVRSDETSLFIDADLRYRPTNLSVLILDLRRVVNNSRGNLTSLESAISTTATVGWNHEWSSRINTRAAIDVNQFDALCPDPSDVVTTTSFEIEYLLRRWLSFGINASQEQRVASNCSGVTAEDDLLSDYERGEFGFFMKSTF